MGYCTIEGARPIGNCFIFLGQGTVREELQVPPPLLPVVHFGWRTTTCPIVRSEPHVHSTRSQFPLV